MDVWEGGIHVPGIIAWPGKIQPKTVTEQVHIIDWLPTLAAMTNINKPNIAFDSIDISPILLSDDTIETRDLYWIWHSNVNRWSLCYGDWKIVRYSKAKKTIPLTSAKDFELYNLKQDPKEQYNLANKHQDILADLYQRFLYQSSKDNLERQK